MTDVTKGEEHSAAYFGETRDNWWNTDWLMLALDRFEMGGVRDVLDAGSGVGHWGRLLARTLPQSLSVTGIDREERWVEEATARSAAFLTRGELRGEFRYLQGDCAALPFPDASFDLVTCQTVLIHVADPEAVLREWARVLRPGGRLLLAEPNNLGSRFATLIAGPELDLDGALGEIRFAAMCERGKARLGLGFNSLGESLPGLLDRNLYERVELAQCDRCASLVPPYDSPAQQAEIAELRDFQKRGMWIWSQEETRRYYEAGGGQDFATQWENMGARGSERLAQIDAGTYARTGAVLLYLLAATRCEGADRS